MMVDEKRMNELIGELCVARAQDAAAITEAQTLGIAASRPYSVEKMKAFCAAGDKMQFAHIRKMEAWNRVRDAAAPEDFLDSYGNNTPRPVPVEERISDWREADREARSAEILLKQALDEFISRGGPDVHDFLVQEVAKARSKANNCLTVALAMIH